MRSVVSRSSQFIVHRPAGFQNYVPAEAKPDARIIRLEPDLLAVSAERIKAAFLKELMLPDRYRGRIHLVLTERKAAEQPIAIISTRYRDRWQFQVEVPDRIEEARLMEGIVQVLLLELVTRDPTPRCPELPAWLVQGLAAHLLASASSPFIFQPEIRTVREVFSVDPAHEARDFLRTNTPLNFTELSLPSTPNRSEERQNAQRYSAQLLVTELLQLHGGRAGLLNMLSALPQCWNWQTAFFSAFSPRFQRMLDMEKWWSLHLVDLLGRDQRQTWPREASLQRLDEILLTPVQMRLGINDLPVITQVPLQEILSQGDPKSQKAMLGQKITQLAVLGLNMSPQCGRLADRYRNTLESYLQNRERLAYAPSLKMNPSLRSLLVINAAIKQLDALDAERAALRKDNRGSARIAPSAAR